MLYRCPRGLSALGLKPHMSIDMAYFIRALCRNVPLDACSTYWTLGVAFPTPILAWPTLLCLFLGFFDVKLVLIFGFLVHLLLGYLLLQSTTCKSSDTSADIESGKAPAQLTSCLVLSVEGDVSWHLFLHL